ncbi:hypothetical protein [Hymenobacter perfusus]|uniref:Uncharacterized protein n=1 Tax=Hymenobacter perfusus TaxID=1236770 RepID=A0A3R9UXD1_9BACT|nr:hypothetical protein [Hymenobacter perfusus]RSK42183.1 hypothetical protein EI293_14740 [Hymenobacter perfusus]
MANAAYYLAIPQPCHEDWRQMTSTQQGRFCQACRKEVLDFTDMAPADILHVIRQATDGSVCGRIPAQVLEESRRQAEAAVAGPNWSHWPQLRSARRWLAAVGLPLLAASPLLARALPPAPATVAPGPRSRPATLRLRVYDPATGQGLGFAQVQLWRADALLLTTQAEADGTAQLPLPSAASDSLRLVVQVPDYRVADELLEEHSLHGTLAIPMQRGAMQLPVVQKAVEAPQMHRMEWSGGISSIVIYEPTPVQRVAQAPKRLFWWLRQRLRKNP